MKNVTKAQISEIRSASRTLVRELGFMSRGIAGTDLSPSAVHAIVEIGMATSLSANDLCELLLLEKSSISRLIQVLIKKKLISETASKTDGRIKLIALTNEGKRQLTAIDKYAETRIRSSLIYLSEDQRILVQTGLQLYTDSLKDGRLNVNEL